MSRKPAPGTALQRLRERTRFGPGLRFELCYALSAVAGGDRALHPAWQRAARAALPGRVVRLAGGVVRSPFLWVLLPDALAARPLEPSFEALLAGLRALTAAELQRELVRGTFHEPRVVEAILRRGAAVPDALARATTGKREWLAYAGLYPYDRAHPTAVVLDQLLRQPEAFKETLLTVLEAFWNGGFHRTWAELQPAYAASIAVHRRAWERLPLQQFFAAAQVRIVVDSARGRLRALRGRYAIGADAIGELVLIPSAFNRERLWSALEHAGTTRVYCPYLDPSIAVAGGPPPAAGPPLDPALLLRALGDATRYALVTLLARRAHTAAELARALAVSKPTITHHMALLREAGLIEEQAGSGGTALVLRRSVLERLSELVVGSLYGEGPLPALKRSRH